MQILVVDDDADAAEMTCELFERFGHTPTAVFSGEDAIRAASRDRPTLALVDIHLPDLSGFDVASVLRRELSYNIYLAAISGWSANGIAAHAFDVGFDEFLLKPARAERLRHVIEMAQRARSMRSTTPAMPPTAR